MRQIFGAHTFVDVPVIYIGFLTGLASFQLLIPELIGFTLNTLLPIPVRVLRGAFTVGVTVLLLMQKLGSGTAHKEE